MPPAALEVVVAGPLSSIQDLGRQGLRRLGVPRSGALDPVALRLANAVAGNAEEEAALEFLLLGPTLRAAHGAVRLGLAGDVEAVVEAREGQRQVGSWRSVTLRPGESLRVGPTRGGRVGYLAVAGGLAAEVVLGSASTYLRGGFGGAGGAALRAGQALSPRSASPPEGPERVLPRPPAAGGPIRAVPGPQDDHFTEEALAAFFGGEYAVRHESDRMGMRLEGPRLAHRPERGAEIVSDATVPGSVQVPGSGQPIVLLADCQTSGGYPKIATVATADLPRVGRLAPGAHLRFERIGVAEAEDLARASEAEVRRLVRSVVPLR